LISPHKYDQQRRTRCEAWCEERAMSSRRRQSEATSRGRTASQPETDWENKGESVSGAECRRAERTEVQRR